jgi:hypothetical protein
MRPEEAKAEVLVVVGVRTDGTNELMADGYRLESPAEFPSAEPMTP